MKRFLTLVFYCLSLFGVYGQVSSTIAEQNMIVPDGAYLFEKAEFLVKHYDTKEIVEHKVITDATTIDSHNMHLESTFREVLITSGYLAECIMSDGQRYRLDEMAKLQPASDEKKDEKAETRLLENVDDYMFLGKELPPYDLRIESDRLIITFAKYSFGQSDVNYTMEAELIVTMTKQKDR